MILSSREPSQDTAVPRDDTDVVRSVDMNAVARRLGVLILDE